METVLPWISKYGYFGIFSLLMLGIIGLPIPDESLLMLSGYLAFIGNLHIVPTIASAFLGSTCGITFSYVLGRSCGSYAIRKYGHVIHVTPQQMDHVHDWFHRMGKWGLMFGYFVPGLRHLTAFTAGTTKVKPSVFALFTYTGGFIWSVSFITAGYFLGKEWIHVSERIHRGFLIGFGMASVLLVLCVLIWQKKSEGR